MTACGGAPGVTRAKGAFIVRAMTASHEAVYEAESSPSARGHGVLLDFHECNGQLAVKAAGLFEEFRGLIQAEAEAQCVLYKDANVLLYEPDKGNGGQPEVPRAELRRILLESLTAGTVRWGHKTAAVSSLGDGRHEVTFANGSAVTTDVLVGADGVWSRMRPLLSDVRPAYAGTAFIETFLFECERPSPLKRIGWHSFRHSLVTSLRSLGVDIKVAEELIRPSSCRMTLEIYTPARLIGKSAKRA
jgi:2-polyprenyl-6-methoxyphenol hydroxylase-like FAD-dependent oxidoreductase